MSGFPHPPEVLSQLRALAVDLEAVGMKGGAEVATRAADLMEGMLHCMTDPDFVRKN